MDRDLTLPQRRQRWIAMASRAALGIALLVALGWTAQRWLRPSLERSEIRTAIVERGPLEATVTATGTIVPRTEQTVSSPVSAAIVTVHVSLGERVHRGQPIMALDTHTSALTLSNLDEQLAVKRAEIRGQDLQRADAIRQARSRRDLLQIDLESREVRLGRRPVRVPLWFARRLGDPSVLRQVAEAVRARPHNRLRVILTSARPTRAAEVEIRGATVVALETPDRDGKLANVNLGFDNVKGYEGQHPYYGATVGRFANRIANARFTLDGKEYTLAANNG